jgi:glycosyltransferase involved in cell wall biosynthesis
MKMHKTACFENLRREKVKSYLCVLFQEHALLSYTANLAKTLSAIGVNVILFTMQPKRKKLKNEGVKVKHFPLSKLIWIIPNERNKKIIERQVFYPWLLKTIKNQDIKVLHLNVASKSELFLKAKNEYKIPLIYTNHYVPEPEPLDAFVDDFLINEEEKFWIPRVCEQASEIVTVSKYAKRRLKEEFGIDSSYIYHGVDLNRYNPFLPRKRKSLGFEPDEKIVLWVARFGHHPYKDPFTFIRAIPLVLQQLPKTKFVMIGNGFLKPFVVELAKKLSVYRHVKIIDFVKHLNLFYAASDVFVLPTFNDNFGLVVAEAMACGKPVIVSNRGAPQEFVRDAGLLFDYGSHHDLADKIIMLLQDEDLRRKLGAKAHKRIVENFTWEKAARNYLDIYEKVLD